MTTPFYHRSNGNRSYFRDSRYGRLSDYCDGVVRQFLLLPTNDGPVLPAWERCMFGAVLPIATVVLWLLTGAVGLEAVLDMTRGMVHASIGYVESSLILIGMLVTSPFWLAPILVLPLAIAKRPWQYRTAAFLSGLSTIVLTFGSMLMLFVIVISILF